jgi:predicted MFS family arabinose efflux permease
VLPAAADEAGDHSLPDCLEVPVTSAHTTRRPVRTALAHSPFRRLVAALAVSQAGDWLYNLALLALVYERTHSSTWVAVTTAARVAPMVLGGPIGGVLADRSDRRRLMVLSDLARMTCMLALALVAVADLPTAVAPALAALASAAATPYPSCVAATTPRLVPADALPGANAARAAVGTLCIVAGPGLGAVLLLLGSATAAFLVNAGTFAVAAALVLSLPAAALSAPERSSNPGVRAELRDGLSALRAAPEASGLVGLDVACSAVYGAHTVLLLLLARQLGLGDAGYGCLLAATGAGGVLGTAIAGRVATGDRTRLVLVAAGSTVAVPATLLALTPGLPLLLLWAMLVGLGSTVVEVATDTALQRCLAPEVLGRAYGLSFPAAVAGIAAGSLVAAPLVSLFGPSGALVVVGALMACVVVLVASVGTGRPPRRTSPVPVPDDAEASASV